MTDRIVNNPICPGPGISSPNRISSAKMVTRICMLSRYIDYIFCDSARGLILKSDL